MDLLREEASKLTEFPDWDVELLMKDIVGAFRLLPLRHGERRFYAGSLANTLLVYLRTAQCSRGGPVSWAAVAALAARCIQSVFARPGNEVDLARMQVYVDDSWSVWRDTPATRRFLLLVGRPVK